MGTTRTKRKQRRIVVVAALACAGAGCGAARQDDGLVETQSAIVASQQPTYHAGAVLSPEIVTLYWGNFAASDVTAMQTYLKRLANYMNGGDSPAGKEPVLFQYGVYAATLGATATSAQIPASGHASVADFQAKIRALQVSGALPPFGAERLFVVFTQGITLDDLGGANADHSAFAHGQYFVRVPFGKKLSGKTPTVSRQISVSHEIFEAATDPFPGTGWFSGSMNTGEIGDVCGVAPAGTSYGTLQLVANKVDGNCAIYSSQRLPQTTIVNTGPNRYDAFAVSPDRSLLHNTWLGGSWSGWEDFNLNLINAIAPTVVSSGPSQLELFGVGNDRAIYHKFFDGSVWSGWENVGGLVNGKIAAISRGPGGVDLVIQSVDGGYWHKAHWSGQWFPGQLTWDYMGGVFIGPPAIASDVSTKLYMYGIGMDGQMFQKFWDGGKWLPAGTDWYPLGGTFISPPTITSWGPNRLDLFALGTDSAIDHMAWTGGPTWHPWERIGGIFNGTPSVVSYAANRLDIVGQGLDFGYYHKDWNGSAWEPASGGVWDYLGGPFLSQPAVTVVPNGVYVTGRDPAGSFLLQGFSAARPPSATGWTSIGGSLH